MVISSEVFEDAGCSFDGAAVLVPSVEKSEIISFLVLFNSAPIRSGVIFKKAEGYKGPSSNI